MNKYARKIRVDVLDKLGGVCVKCGCNNKAALEINHINGGGSVERKKQKHNTKGFYLDILKGRRTTNDIELTCKICNSHHYLVTLKGIPDRWTITYG